MGVPTSPGVPMTRPSLVLALALALTLSACAGAPVVAGSADPEVG